MQNQGLLSILTSFLLFTVFASAFSIKDVFAWDTNGVIIARQDNNNNNNNNGGNGQSQSSSSASNQPSQTSSGARNSATPTISSGSGSGSQSQSATNSGSRSGSATISGTSLITGSGGLARGNSTKTIAINPLLPPGGVQMLTPAPIAGMTFLKVGDQITFAWNYTSLSVPPSYVDVIATNTVNHQTYTIAGNTTWNATQTIVWDTADYTASNSIPFVVASYTLMVYDAASDPTTVPSAGYLGAFTNLVFGIYTPQPYTPLNEFKCASCSGAMSMHEKQALSVLLGTCAITVLSFTWFASGFGLF